MIKSEITLREAIEYIKGFSPVKIIFNNIVLYNDFYSDVEIDVLEDGTKVYGENKRPLDVVPDRLWQFDKYVVTFVDIKVVVALGNEPLYPALIESNESFT